MRRNLMTRVDTKRVAWKSIAGVFLLLLALTPGTAWAQGEASLGGVVTDSTGAIIVGATVRVKNTETSAIRTLVTDSAGRYDASLLSVGKYDVTAEQPGFHAESKTGITLDLEQQATQYLQLAVGGGRQSIHVEASALELAVTTADCSGVVGEHEVKNLP